MTKNIPLGSTYFFNPHPSQGNEGWGLNSTLTFNIQCKQRMVQKEEMECDGMSLYTRGSESI